MAGTLPGARNTILNIVQDRVAAFIKMHSFIQSRVILTVGPLLSDAHILFPFYRFKN